MNTFITILSVAITLLLIIWIPINLFFPNLFSPIRLCMKCGHSGKTKKQLSGSILIEIFLWICFIIPGVLYSLWRHGSKKIVCASCGGQEQLIPLDSPRAKELAALKK